jgi:hypothetical protein
VDEEGGGAEHDQQQPSHERIVQVFRQGGV